MWSPVGPLGMNGVIDCNMAPTADRCEPQLTGSRRLAVPAASGFPAPEGRSTDTILAVLTAVRTDRLVRHGKCRCRGHNPSLWRDF
jgi:hypothetical protein